MLETFTFPLDGLDRAEIWRSAASSLADLGASILGEFGLHVTVFGPQKIIPARHLKQLFDGVITALQTDETPSDDAINRLAAHCNAPRPEILHLLSARKPRLLVSSQKPLIGLTANGFALNPADHLCTEGTLATEFSETSLCTVIIYNNDAHAFDKSVAATGQSENSMYFSTSRTTSNFLEYRSVKTNLAKEPQMTHDDLDAFARWHSQRSKDKTYLSDARRVQKVYGSLEQLYNDGKLEAVSEILRYSKADELAERKNPTELDIALGGTNNMFRSIYNNLAAARSAINAFKKYKETQLGRIV